MPSQTTTKTLTLTELLTHLVRMPTLSSDHATNNAALDWVQDQLHDLPLHLKRFEQSGRSSLVATTTGTKDPKNPRLWLLGHMDVVGIDDPALFTPVIRDGRLIGRGAFDMKYALAIFIKLFQDLGPELANYDLGLIINTDEETDGRYGAGYLVEQGYRGQAVLNPECGTPWHLDTGVKGCSFWHLTAKGAAAHGSRPWEGDNALDRLIRFVQEVQRHAVLEPCGDNRHLHHSITLSRLSGGNSFNQVAECAEADLDIRRLPGTSIEHIQAWIDEAKAAVPGVEATLTVQTDPFTVAETKPVQLLRTIVKQVTGHPPVDMVAHGSGDSRHFAYHDIPVLILPGPGGNHHGPQEWMDLAGLEQYYTVVRQFAHDWAKTA